MVLINYIEGLPCAGKSSLAIKLEANNKKVIHELGRVLNKEEFLGDGTTVKEINLIDERFINKESGRYIGIRKDDGNVYFDRSFLTHLTYAYAYSRFTNLPSLKNTIKLYERALENNDLIIPDIIINVNISSEISIERQKEKIKRENRALPYFWREKTFLNDLLYAYSKLYENYTGKVIEIDGKLTTEEKLAQVLHFSKSYLGGGRIDLDHYLNSIL